MKKRTFEKVEPTLANVLYVAAKYSKNMWIRRFCTLAIKKYHYNEISARYRQAHHKEDYSYTDPGSIERSKRWATLRNRLSTEVLGGRYEPNDRWKSFELNESFDLPGNVTVSVKSSCRYIYDKSKVSYHGYHGEEHYASVGTIFKPRVTIVKNRRHWYDSSKEAQMGWTELSKYLLCIRKETYDVDFEVPDDLAKEFKKLEDEEHRHWLWSPRNNKDENYYKHVRQISVVGFIDNSKEDGRYLDKDTCRIYNYSHNNK